jgi:hypothetical protein
LDESSCPYPDKLKYYILSFKLLFILSINIFCGTRKEHWKADAPAKKMFRVTAEKTIRKWEGRINNWESIPSDPLSSKRWGGRVAPPYPLFGSTPTLGRSGLSSFRLTSHPLII